MQALSSRAVFSQRLSFLLFCLKSQKKLENLELQITGKCLSDTLFDFKAFVVHC